jgi:hypothetical protein
MTDENSEFTPILLGPGLSPASCEVAIKITGVPTLAEMTARLGALPQAALVAAITAEPTIYKSMIGDARDTAAYLRALAETFTALADRLTQVSGDA